MPWEDGDVQPSLREEILEIMNEDEEAAWDIAELRGEIFPELEFPSDMTSPVGMAEALGINRRTAVIQSILEQLVAEGEVEKREFRMDSIARITVNEQEYEQVRSQVEGDVMEDVILYKAL